MLSCSSPLDFHREVDPWRCTQSKWACYPLQVEPIDIKNVPLFMARICLQIRPISIFGSTVQVVISLDQLGHLFSDVGQLFRGKLVLIWTNLFLPEEAQEAKLVFEQEKQGATAPFRPSTGSSDAMDVVIRVIRRIKLDDPVDLREVKASLRDICA